MNAPTTPQHLIPHVQQRPVPDALVAKLKAHFGERCSTAMAVREQHGRDESAFTTVPPPAVVGAFMAGVSCGCHSRQATISALHGQSPQSGVTCPGP